MSGAVIFFEGIDHVGKSKMIINVLNHLRESSIKVTNYCLPGDQSKRTLGGLVYRIHHNTSEYFDAIDPLSLQILHIASHIDTLNHHIIPDVLDGKIVLVDRSWWSTYSYGLASGISNKNINAIIKPEINILNTIPSKKVKYLLFRKDSYTTEYPLHQQKKILKSYNYLFDKYEKLGMAESDHPGNHWNKSTEWIIELIRALATTQS